MAYPPIAKAQIAHNTLAGIAAGLLAALLFDAFRIGAASGGAIFLLLSPLPVFVAGLGWGSLSATIAASVATLVLVVLGGASTGPMSGPSLGFAFALLIGIPSVMWSWQAIKRSADARVWRSTGALALMVVAYGLVLLLLGVLSVISGDLGSDPGQTLNSLVQSSIEASVEGVSPADRERVATIAATLTQLPSVVVATWIAMLTANGILGQALLVRFEHAIRPTPMMADLSLPRWYSVLGLVLFAGALVLPGWYGLVVANLLIVQSFALFLAGLAVLHAGTQRLAQRLVVLIMVYAIMIVVVLPALPFVAVGFVEPWLRLKTRLGRPQSTG